MMSDRELYEPIDGYPDTDSKIPPDKDFNNLGVSWEAVHGKKANAKSSPNASTYKATETGAVREGLGIPYTRYVPLEAIAAAAASLLS